MKKEFVFLVVEITIYLAIYESYRALQEILNKLDVLEMELVTDNKEPLEPKKTSEKISTAWDSRSD